MEQRAITDPSTGKTWESISECKRELRISRHFVYHKIWKGELQFTDSSLTPPECSRPKDENYRHAIVDPNTGKTWESISECEAELQITKHYVYRKIWDGELEFVNKNLKAPERCRLKRDKNKYLIIEPSTGKTWINIAACMLDLQITKHYVYRKIWDGELEFVNKNLKPPKKDRSKTGTKRLKNSVTKISVFSDDPKSFEFQALRLAELMKPYTRKDWGI